MDIVLYLLRSLKRVFLILTLVAILLQSFSKGVILLGFKINRSFIAQSLCVKKDEANNCCKGSCQLTKQLKEDDHKDDKNTAQNTKDSNEIQLFCETLYSLIPVSVTTGNPVSHYSFALTNPETDSIFHPPSLA
jgi:hypothetical protein